MSRFRIIAKAAARHLIAGAIWWVALIAFAVLGLGPRNAGRLAGAGYLLDTAKFPDVSGFSEEYRSVVITIPNTWAEFRHEARGIPVQDAVEHLEKAMQSIGYDKTEEGPMVRRQLSGGWRWLLFTSKQRPSFCFSTIVTVKNDTGCSITILDSKYKMYSPTAYEVEKELLVHFGPP